MAMADLFIVFHPCPAEPLTQSRTKIVHAHTLCHQGKFNNAGVDQSRVCVSFES
jgi:hypothetical protein